MNAVANPQQRLRAVGHVKLTGDSVLHGLSSSELVREPPEVERRLVSGLTIDCFLAGRGPR